MYFMSVALCCISSGSSLFAKVPVYGFPKYKGLKEAFVKNQNLMFNLLQVLSSNIGIKHVFFMH